MSTTSCCSFTPGPPLLMYHPVERNAPAVGGILGASNAAVVLTWQG